VSGFLLDTNVVSELVKDTPESQVIGFLNEQQDFWLPTIVVHELEFGLQLLPEGRRREQLRAAQEAVVNEYSDRIIPLGRTESELAATLRAAARRSGHTVSLADALIAGTAKVHDLCVVTRNVGDFAFMDVEISNPWPRAAQ
jgi:predicted nucleic acid-binding protein